METQTRFDLNAAIANWQQELAGQPDLTPIVRRELETHLRDTIAELQSRGLNNEESFWFARRRLGQTQQLSEEFSKADPAKVWRERAFWMVLALLIVSVWGAGITPAFMLLLNRAGVFQANFWFFSVVRTVFDWSPLFVGMILLVKGRFDFAGRKWAALFNSPIKLVVTGAAVMIFNVGVTAWYCATQTHDHSLIWLNVGNYILSMMIWPSVLLGLLIWLRPGRNSPELKTA